MERYDYLEHMVSDILDYIEENDIVIDEEHDRFDVQERLEDELWTEDSVTENASGSYTFNAWQAEEYVAHNMDLLQEALYEFGYDNCWKEIAVHGAEWADVTIRCYLLSQAISNALDEIE